jgi:hypothetical protein
MAGGFRINPGGQPPRRTPAPAEGKGKQSAELSEKEKAKIAKNQAKEKAANAANAKVDAEVAKQNKLSPDLNDARRRLAAARDFGSPATGAPSASSPHSSGGIQNENSVFSLLKRTNSDINPQPSAPMGGPTSAGPHSAPTSPRGGFQMESTSPGTPGSSEPSSPNNPQRLAGWAGGHDSQSLSRSNSDLHSTSSFGTPYSAGSLPSTPPDSPLPKDISRSSSGLSHQIEVPIMGAGADWPATRPGPMNFDHSLPNSPTSSEGSVIPYRRSNSDPGPSGSPNSSSSEASTPPSPLNWGDVHNFRIRNQNPKFTEGYQISGDSPGRIVWEEGDKNTIHPRWRPTKLGDPIDVPPMRIGSPLNWDDFPVNVKSQLPPPGPPRIGPDPSRHTGDLNDPVSIPGTPSSPGTPATRPGPGPLTFPDSPSSLSSQSSISSASSDHELPVTQHAQPRPPERQNALGNLSTKAKVGLGVAAGLTAGGALAAGMLGSGDDESSNGQVST